MQHKKEVVATSTSDRRSTNKRENMGQIMTNPEPKQIKDLRKSVNLDTTQAGNLLHVSARTFQRWERGNTKMPLGYWELFELKVRIVRSRMGKMA